MPTQRQTSEICDAGLFSPAHLIQQFRPPSGIQYFTARSCVLISAISSCALDKLLIIVGPCAIRATDSAPHYADYHARTLAGHLLSAPFALAG